MDVDGDKVEGAGRIIYQVVLPLDRTVWNDLERLPPSARAQEGDPSTQPTTDPATQPATSAENSGEVPARVP
jgi:hypothetical protein